MKKFISMVMAAAMVVSLVPATAFADTGSAKAVAKVIDVADVSKDAKAETAMDNETTELQLKVDGNGQYAGTADNAKHELTFTLDGAEFKVATAEEIGKNVTLKGTAVGEDAISDVEKDSFKLTITKRLMDEDVIAVNLHSNIKLKSVSVGKKATIAVDSAMVTTDDLTFAEVKDTGIKATVKKVAEVAEEGITPLEKDLKIEANVGKFEKGQILRLKLNSGFEFNMLKDGTNYEVVDTDKYEDVDNKDGKYAKGEKEVAIKVTVGDNNDATDTITIKAADMKISVDSAKVGAECKLTVKAVKNNKVGFSDTADAIVIAKVVADAIEVSVDEDEDLPVIYSGVNANNKGITDDSDHEALEVTIKEPTAGTLDAKKVLTMELPDGVYVTNVNSNDDFGANEAAFKAAYKKGDYEKFEFARRTLNATPEGGKAGELKFTLTLVAEPGFTGDVTLKVDGAGLDKAQEVKIAKFASPYTVEAAQNDLIIDYRNTKVPTNIVVKEAKEGLWEKNSTFVFGVDKFEDRDFENDATYKVDDKSDMEVKTIKNKLGFKVDKESSDAAAVVTISDISLYMNRNLAAGAYDLTLDTTGSNAFMAQMVWGYDKVENPTLGGTKPTEGTVSDKYYNNDVEFGHTVKEGFINIITAGRDQDDASFTKKVVVPVGEKYLIAGEEQVALDVPAYISAQGYTMLPVRAVATALGINNNNVLWNQASRTVTILYGQRIITMVAGQKVVTVNGNTIPASATVQIKDGRTFLPMRDLATALGVTDITWDAATKTATMNGSK